MGLLIGYMQRPEEDIDVGLEIILKWILQKEDGVVVRTGCVCLRIMKKIMNLCVP
jgi:hypothetical protein